MSRKTICKSCGYISEEGRAQCAFCGQPMEKKRLSASQIAVPIIVAAVLLTVFIVEIVRAVPDRENISGQENVVGDVEISSDVGVSSDDAYKKVGTISLLEFDKIQMDMTYEEVCRIVGGEGVLESEYGSLDVKYYTWPGNGSSYSEARITFTHGKVSSKNQYGLK